MRHFGVSFAATIIASFILSSCSYYGTETSIAGPSAKKTTKSKVMSNYASRLPQSISTRERTILIDPRVHAWGAYDASGQLIRAGLATAGGKWCADIRRGCKTAAGTFRIKNLGHRHCKSSKYPLPRGGAPMPYCMFFNGGQGLHGSYKVVEGNVSHGCVRVTVRDAEWLRFNFANIGTKVIVRPY